MLAREAFRLDLANHLVDLLARNCTDVLWILNYPECCFAGHANNLRALMRAVIFEIYLGLKSGGGGTTITLCDGNASIHRPSDVVPTNRAWTIPPGNCTIAPSRSDRTLAGRILLDTLFLNSLGDFATFVL
jgi:hypothetical protein